MKRIENNRFTFSKDENEPWIQCSFIHYNWCGHYKIQIDYKEAEYYMTNEYIIDDVIAIIKSFDKNRTQQNDNQTIDIKINIRRYTNQTNRPFLYFTWENMKYESTMDNAIVREFEKTKNKLYDK